MAGLALTDYIGNNRWVKSSVVLWGDRYEPMGLECDGWLYRSGGYFAATDGSRAKHPVAAQSKEWTNTDIGFV